MVMGREGGESEGETRGCRVGGGRIKGSVAVPDTNPDLDPPDPHVLGHLDPDPYPVVRGVDPALDPDPETLFDFLSLKNDVMYLQKKFFYKNYFLVGILKVNDENSRIRIRIH
jgi:hypothetical protein